jgi:HEAT repeat protein
LLESLAAAGSVALADALAPLAARSARGHPRAFESLAAVAKRFRPPPLSVVRALESLASEPAESFLLELGKASSDATLLRAAGGSGDPRIVATLIRWAEGENRALAAASLRALAGLEPPRSTALSLGPPSPPEATPPRGASQAAVRALMQMEAAGNAQVDLKHLLTREILAVRSPELKVTLLGYLALFRDESLGAYFAALYRSEASEPLRVAAISALGRLGERSTDLLIAELSSTTTPLSIRKACAHGLGAARSKPATRQLIACLDDPELQADALRALSRIAGTRVGNRPADWIRWWRAQPECKPEDRDPEAE